MTTTQMWLRIAKEDYAKSLEYLKKETFGLSVGYC